MSRRRIATPQDLGAIVRDARTAEGVTQVQLADRADVSREWLIGLEQGKRPRAEFTKVLGVLAALDLPLVIDEAADPEDSGDASSASRDGLSTADITRRAIERARGEQSFADFGQNSTAALWGAKAAIGALNTGWQGMPAPSVANLMPAMTMLADLMPKSDFMSLLPQASPTLLSYLQATNQAAETAADGHGDGDRDEQHEQHEPHQDEEGQ